jgi:ribosomal protein L29
MADLHPADELTQLRAFLGRLESGELRLRRNHTDVTKQEISILKREIAYLETVLKRLKAGEGK